MLDICNSFSVKFLKNFNFSVRFSDMINMEGLTVAEMAEELGIKETTVRQRLMIAGIKPITHSPVYPTAALEAIRNVPGRGRPPRSKPEEPGKGRPPKKKE
jgi:predicted ArsR family transcriptional regulator